MKAPVNFSDKVAYKITMFLRWLADTFFKKRYGHRAVVLETVAGVPGMVAGMWNHLRSLRKMKPDDRGWIKTCLLYTSPSPRDLSTSRMPSSA